MMAGIISVFLALAKHVTSAGWAGVGDAYRAPPELTTTGEVLIGVACLVLFVSFPVILVAWIIQNRRRFSAKDWFVIAGMTALAAPFSASILTRGNIVPTALLAMALVPIFLGLRKMRVERVRAMRTHFGRCPECNYDLTGNVSGVCPECGERVETAKRRIPIFRHSSRPS